MKTKTVAKAAVRSYLVPGWGSVYAGQKDRGWALIVVSTIARLMLFAARAVPTLTTGLQGTVVLGLLMLNTIIVAVAIVYAVHDFLARQSVQATAL